MYPSVSDIGALVHDHNTKLSILDEPHVIQWLYNDLSFLPTRSKKAEDAWGLELVHKVLTKSKATKQWTNRVGELIVQDILRLQHVATKKCATKSGLRPDLESERFVYEVKTGTYLTPGTAGEKIMAVPYKYIDVPEIYGKPLSIVCVGRAELDARDKFGLLSGRKLRNSKKRQSILDMYRTMDIVYHGATELLSSWYHLAINRTSSSTTTP